MPELRCDDWSETVRDGNILLGRIGGAVAAIEPGRLAAWDPDSDLVHVAFPLAGRLRIEQSGRSVELCPGDWGLYGGRTDFRCQFDAGAEALVATAPSQALFYREISPEQQGARRFSCRGGTAFLARNYLANVLSERDALKSIIGPELICTAIRLIRLAAVERLLADSQISPQQRLRISIRDYIDRSLSSRDLSVEDIACAHSCSKRHVHKVFSITGQTLTQYILQVRLERCHRDLQRPELAHLSLSQIAFSWGFDNPGYFSRAFRRHFGFAPSDCRSHRTGVRFVFPRGSSPPGKQLFAQS